MSTVTYNWVEQSCYEEHSNLELCDTQIRIILLLLKRADDLWIMIIKSQHFPQPVWFGLVCGV